MPKREMCPWCGEGRVFGVAMFCVSCEKWRHRLVPLISRHRKKYQRILAGANA